MTDDYDALLERALRDPDAYLQEGEKLACEERLVDFCKFGMRVLEPQTKFKTGWALEAVCEHLEAVTAGQIDHLLINIPPGHSKSMVTSVMWPAWEWGPQNKPALQYINASYNVDLPLRDQVYSRDIIQSAEYQQHWGDRFKLRSDIAGKAFYQNDKGGKRFAASVGKGITGHRGHRIIVDDPHNVEGAESDAVRHEAVRWFAETLSSRTHERTAFVVIMQRLHEEDISGHILDELGEDYVHLCLPARFEEERRCVVPVTGFRDPREKEGELLWPDLFPENRVASQEKKFRAFGGDYAVAGQLQQRPSPREGGMFKTEFWQYIDWKDVPKDGTIVRGWDLAGSKDKRAAYTAGVRIRRCRGAYYIEDVTRGQVTPHGVKEMILDAARNDGRGCTQCLPQDPAQAGKYQKFDLANLLAGFVFRFSPESGSKEDRARPLASQAEAGTVYLVRGKWNAEFVREATNFPNGKWKDQIDAASRAFGELLVVKTPTVSGGCEEIG